MGNQTLVFVLTAKSDLPVTGQPINVGDDAYRQTMRHRTLPPPEPK